jgi:pimeloyl-ACP methyl ester carboxylesterase
MIIKIKDIDINYERAFAADDAPCASAANGAANAAQSLVFLHGWGADINVFSPLRRYYARGFRVVAIDFPAFGKSGAPLLPFTIFDYYDIIIATLNALSINEANFICHSFGGRVGILLGAKNPELVKRLILVDAAGVRPKRRLGYYFKVYLYKFKKTLIKLGLLDKKAIEKAGSADYRGLSAVMKRTFVSVVNEDLTPFLKDIAAPTLLIYGEKDKDTPPYMAKIMKKHIPDSGLALLKGAGHFSFLDKPNEFKIITDKFLSQ